MGCAGAGPDAGRHQHGAEGGGKGCSRESSLLTGRTGNIVANSHIFQESFSGFLKILLLALTDIFVFTFINNYPGINILAIPPLGGHKNFKQEGIG